MSEFAFLAIYVVIFAVPPILLIWIADRLIDTRIAIAIGILAIALMLCAIVGLHHLCTTPLCQGPDWQGPCHYQCDSVGGVFLFVFIWFGGPVSVLLIAPITLLKYLKFRRKRAV